MEDLLPLAALSAANFGASERMAQLLVSPTSHSFSHKGTKQNIHFARVNHDFILVTLFDNEIPLGWFDLDPAKWQTRSCRC